MITFIWDNPHRPSRRSIPLLYSSAPQRKWPATNRATLSEATLRPSVPCSLAPSIPAIPFVAPSPSFPSIAPSLRCFLRVPPRDTPKNGTYETNPFESYG